MVPRPLPETDDLPRALYTAAQVRAFDRLAIEHFGIPGATLMERAGAAVVEALLRRWPAARRIDVLVGTGNNGGDGFVVARLAAQQGLCARVLQLGDRERLTGDAAVNAARWREIGGDWEPFTGLAPDADVIVDAMLGTGLERPVGGAYAEAIAAVNRHRAPTIAVDVPSGLDADDGIVLGDAVRAQVTVSFIALKRGLFTADGPDCTGELVFAGLGVPARVFASSVLAARRIDWLKLRDRLTRRRRNAHKRHFGHVLVIGGDHGFGGAAQLAATAALRTGAGLVSLATRSAHVASILAARPEVMAHAVEDGDALEPLLGRASVLAVGPGLGRSDWGRALWQRALAAGLPTVVDADALHLLAQAGLRRDDWVLTPHSGEAKAMLAAQGDTMGVRRFDVAARLQARFGGCVVLKGVGSLVQCPGDTPPAVCSDGNPGMATGGMGDALTGIIAGLLAQGLDLRDAAEAGVCLHAAAGDRAAATGGMRGLLPGDLIDALRPLVNPA